MPRKIEWFFHDRAMPATRRSETFPALPEVPRHSRNDSGSLIHALNPGTHQPGIFELKRRVNVFSFAIDREILGQHYLHSGEQVQAWGCIGDGLFRTGHRGAHSRQSEAGIGLQPAIRISREHIECGRYDPNLLTESHGRGLGLNARVGPMRDRRTARKAFDFDAHPPQPFVLEKVPDLPAEQSRIFQIQPLE